MTTEGYETISEIYREGTEEFASPLEHWEIEVVDQGLHKEFADIG